MSTKNASQPPPSSCISCHVIGIASASGLAAYMYYQGKRAKTPSHRFTCALLGIGFLIFASHRVSSLFKDISHMRIASSGRLRRTFDEQR